MYAFRESLSIIMIDPLRYSKQSFHKYHMSMQSQRCAWNNVNNVME